MKNNEFRLPLIQSGLVLVVIFLLIAFVAGSDAHGVLGGITSIFKGFYYLILFVIVLVFAIIFSIILLIAIFIGAVALYSPDTAKEMFNKLQQNSSALITSYTSCCGKDSVCSSTEVSDPTPAESDSSSNEDSWQKYVVKNEDPKPDKVETLSKTLSLEIENIGGEVKLLQTKNTTLSESLAGLKESVDEISASEVTTRTDQVESRQDELIEKIDTAQQKLDSLDATVTTHTQSSSTLIEKLDGFQAQLTALTDELELLKKTQEEPAVEEPIDEVKDDLVKTEEEQHRIFSYIEKKKDRELFSNSIAEAVAKDMSFAKIDDFLTQSLPKKIDSIIKEHPSLTKDYIRDCRKSK